MPQMSDCINGGAGILLSLPQYSNIRCAICLWILVLDLYKIYKYSIASYDKSI